MNIKFLLFVFGIVTLTACSSAYKTGQTPDDVYYSPGRETAEYVTTQQDRNRYEGNQQYQQYEDYANDIRNDRFLRLSLANRMYLNTFSDFYWNDWRFGYTNSWYNPWNNYFYWNNFYNPYCNNTVYYGKPGIGSMGNYNRPVFNLHTYNNNNYSKTNPRYSFNRTTYNNDNYSNRNNNNSSTLRKVFSSSSNSRNNNNSGAERIDRSYTPSNNNSSRSSGSSNSSSSGSSSSGSSGGVSRPSRGGGL